MTLDEVKEKVRQIWAIITGNTLDANITQFDQLIQDWWAIYRGNPEWLDYSYMSLSGSKQKRTRKSMGAAKIICSELAGLCFTEPPQLSTDKSVEQFLSENNFWQKMTEYAEYGAALGGFALKLYSNDGALHIDYVSADCFVPISWDTSRVTEADFVSRIVRNTKKFLRIERHRKITDGTFSGYEITTDYYFDTVGYPRAKAVDAGEEENIVRVATETPLFVYIKTPEANNKSLESPLGISVYANAKDTLESLDIAFDALQHEIVMGKRRIIVPVSCVRSVVDPKTKKQVQYFDPADETFVAFNNADAQEMQITDNTVEIRTESIKAAIQTLLSVLSVQVGFSAGYLNFDGVSMKTATEVVSENSKTFKTKCAYENNIGNGILQLLNAVREIGAEYGIQTSAGEYTIAWNDSIVEDRNTKAKYWIDRYNAGTCSLVRVLMELDGLSEAYAQKEAERIKSERATVDVGSLFGGMDGASGTEDTDTGEAQDEA